MSDLVFEVGGVEPDRYAATPTLLFKLRVTETTGAPIHALALRCQIRIEPQRRRYEPAEEERLLAMFGETPQWGDSLRPFLWTHATAMVAGFEASTEVDLIVACTYDFEVAAVKYLHSLETARFLSCCCSTARRSLRGRPGSRSTPYRGTRRRPSGCRWACGGR